MLIPEKRRFFTEDLMQEIRTRFLHMDSDPFSGQRVFLDAASGSHRLKAMVEALAREAGLPDQMGRANPASNHVNDVVAKAFQDVRDFLGAKSGVVMPAMSSTHAIYRAVNAILSASGGTNVVTTDLDHPSVYDATHQFARMCGKEWRVAHIDPDTGSVHPGSILERVDERTCLIGLIHGSNLTGTVLDIKAVVEGARKINPNICVLADGVQYAPHAPIDVEDLGIDVYVFGPYKAFCVKGIGLAYLSDRVATLPHWALRGKKADDWILGSADNGTYAAWSAVVDYLVWLGGHFTHSDDRRVRIVTGLRAADDHERALLYRCLHGTEKQTGLLDMGHVTVHAMTEDISKRFCLFLFSLAGVTSHQGVALYNRAGIRVHNRTRDAYSRHSLEVLGLQDAVRLSATHCNTPTEIDAFLNVTAAIEDLSEEDLSRIPKGSGAPGLGEG